MMRQRLAVGTKQHEVRDGDRRAARAIEELQMRQRQEVAMEVADSRNDDVAVWNVLNLARPGAR